MLFLLFFVQVDKKLRRLLKTEQKKQEKKQSKKQIAAWLAESDYNDPSARYKLKSFLKNKSLEEKQSRPSHLKGKEIGTF
jgi:hypothetical protein